MKGFKLERARGRCEGERRPPLFFSPLTYARPHRNSSLRLKNRRQRFLKFPDLSLTNVKFPWPTELKISQNMLPSQPFLPRIYLCFQQVKCGVHEFMVPSHTVQKGLIFLKPNISLSFNFMNIILPNTIHVRKMYKCTVKMSFFPDFCQRLKFSLTRTEISTFPWPWRNFFPDHFLTCGNHEECVFLRLASAKTQTLHAM